MFRYLLVLLTLASGAAAAIDRTKRPEPDPAPAASFPDYKTQTLPNGLKVFVIEDDRKPTITFRLLIKSGSINDGAKTGLSGFVAGLLNRGTEKRDAATFAAESDYLGVKVEAVSGPDAIAVSAGGMTKYTDKILDLLSDAVLHPVFPEEQFAKEQRRALSALESEKQEPESLAEKLKGKLVFGAHPYGAYRTPETVTSIRRDDIAAFHHAWFTPNNATLAVVGDVQADQILPLVEKAFAEWKQREVPIEKHAALPRMHGRSVHLVDRPGSVQSNIIVAEPGPARNNPDVPELNVTNATLGGGFSGRLFQNLRERHGWTYGAYSAFGMLREGGEFTAEAQTRNAVTAPAIEETLKEMQRLRDERVPEAELDLQRQYNVGNYLLSLENSGRIAQRVQDIDLYGLPADFYKTYARRMGATTSAMVQELAKKYIDTENLAIVVVGEAKDVKDELEKLGKLYLYDQQLKLVGP